MNAADPAMLAALMIAFAPACADTVTPARGDSGVERGGTAAPPSQERANGSVLASGGSASTTAGGGTPGTTVTGGRSGSASGGTPAAGGTSSATGGAAYGRGGIGAGGTSQEAPDAGCAGASRSAAGAAGALNAGGRSPTASAAGASGQDSAAAGVAGLSGADGGAAGLPAAAGASPGPLGTALVFEFSGPDLDGWVAAGHAESIQTALDEGIGEPPGSARISARMAPATTASFSRFLPAPLNLTHGTIRVPVLLSSSAGPLWFEVFLLSGSTQSWSSSAAFELWPNGGWVYLELPVDQVAADPREVVRFGVQFGPEGWLASGDVVFNIDHVTVD